MEVNPLIIGVIFTTIFIFGVIGIVYYYFNKMEKEVKEAN